MACHKRISANEPAERLAQVGPRLVVLLAPSGVDDALQKVAKFGAEL